MSASNTETETETETGSPDQHPECEFDADDLDISGFYKRRYDLEEWECSRPVWEEASGNRCVWHASDGQTQKKPHAELEGTVSDGDLHGSVATGVNLSRIDFPADVGFIDADLSEAGLRRADLSEADLGSANLSGADLGSADLPEANLSFADLSGADLTSADLPEANLGSADLSGADLRFADLSGANLGSANLSGADLSHITVENIRVNNFTKFGSRLPKWLPGPPHARAYHDFRSEVSNTGYDKVARDLYFLEQKARTRTALPSQPITFVGGLLSGLFTGYGVRPRQVFLSTIFVIIVTTLWFNQAGIVYDEWNTTYELLGREFNTGSVYYSVTTFVTAPPHPPQSTGLLTNLLLTLETYVGTVLTLLLGYALSTRSRI